jgi:hypothetical protein
MRILKYMNVLLSKFGRQPISDKSASFLGLSLAFVSAILLVFRSLNPTVSTLSNVVIVTTGVTGILILLWFFPKSQVEGVTFDESDKRFTAEGEARKTLATVVGGMAFLATFYVSWSTFTVEREKTTMEEYKTGIEEVFGKEGYSKIAGAIVLERLAKSSPTDSDGIYGVLSQSLRDSRQDDFDQRAAIHPEFPPRADYDVNNAVAIIGRRFPSGASKEHRAYLNGADLRGITVNRLHFEWAVFEESKLQGAHFYHSFLSHADFINASAQPVEVRTGGIPPTLSGPIDEETVFRTPEKSVPYQTTFYCVDLSDANLSGSGSNFEGVSFAYSNLRNAHLEWADLRGAKFGNSNLSDAH